MLRSTVSAAIIKCLDSHFARYGVPVGLNKWLQSGVEGNGELFGGNVHHRNSPLWPRANGEVERQNCRSLLKAMRIAQAVAKNWPLESTSFCWPTDKLVTLQQVLAPLTAFQEEINYQASRVCRARRKSDGCGIATG